eukprot:TRINITY_DN5315_c0_g1_i1.p1 TRINITY_DN5315_c0_g1~~TRINITY_DN5315_c0_g1_i1.p1  ORF type:complete len:617 (-),score=129.10 TRINITY_DN5315_c0_g1_i1:59-1843(-)
MNEDKTLSVHVERGEKLCGKNNRGGSMTSSPYCTLTVLGKDGTPSGKERKTTVIKDNLEPVWDETIKIEVGKESCGLQVEVWDRHRVRSDKFMGRVILKFSDSKLMSSEEIIDDWFKLDKRGKKETVSGRIKLRVQYGTLKVAEKTEPEDVQKTEKRDTEKKEDKKSSRKKDKEGDKKASKHKESPAGWNSQDAGLAGSRWVRIKELKPTEPYPFPREGPHNVTLSPLPRHNITVNKNLVSSSNYSFSVARSDVKVRGNKWYFEVKVKSIGNNIFVGWVSDLYTQWDDKTSWFVSSDGQKRIGSNSQPYGPKWSVGDIIGCGLNLESGEIHVSKNGASLPGKFAFDMVKRGVDVGEHFYPTIAINGYGSCEVNFGETPLQYPMMGFYPLHFVLPTVQQEEVRDLFNVFKKAGQEAEDDDEDHINFNGTLALAEQLGIDPTTDLGLLLIAWKLNCTTTFEFTLEEWMIGWSTQGCVTLEDFKEAIQKWKKDIQDPNNYITFYTFCGDYLKEGKKVLPINEAIQAWDLILKPRGWPLYDDWIAFVKENVKAINPDTWNMLWKFISEFQKDMKAYNEADCWPYTFDEFHEWYNEIHP